LAAPTGSAGSRGNAVQPRRPFRSGLAKTFFRLARFTRDAYLSSVFCIYPRVEIDAPFKAVRR